ncbi:ATP-binding protein [Bdellovibrio reynosensis]|uniref:ATP-binding protein n=1 Tax=Bdellovibrio reynosensis TaxID=2835041 RepID=A0ABY4C9W9_9BACT|nr:ATP-binding protein [Bdellovibrio reynosensis]UOF01762.1 ATP-binding protein [Bdellovibrio reynosensis]
MKIKSLIRENDRLVPVDVEISFIPGLPQVQFLGLPDQAIKESIHRIKSALRAQDFDFPKAQQVLVNLRPAHLKKSSRGLELAVALGILWESEQIRKPKLDEVFVYGELSLNGEVFEPDDLCEDFEDDQVTVWTGRVRDTTAPFDRAALSVLKDVQTPLVVAKQPRQFPLVRPQFGLDLNFPERQAEMLKLVALGEHSLLLAGPAGSGKSTFAKTLQSLLAAPSQDDIQEIIRNNKTKKDEVINWRPLIQPHHSTSPLGLIGGGIPPFKGEISRAHKGILVLDELLEFHPRAQEALREPMEESRIRIRRGRYYEDHPAENLVIATTNLCPCGDWTPQAKVVCGRSLKKCQSYMERLSGPLVDRFQVIFFTKKREDGQAQSGMDILAAIETARNFRKGLAGKDPRFVKPSGRWTWDELIRDLPSFYLQELFPKELASRRRDLATLRVARTFADLEACEKMLPAHVEKALKITFLPFESLKRLGC